MMIPVGTTETTPPHASFPADDPRRLARIRAMQFLYQLQVQNGQNLDMLGSFLNEQSGDPAINETARQWVCETWERREAIDRQIAGVSKNWEVSRISPVDLSNLRLAVYQLLYCDDIPDKAAINEAIELAKQFSTVAAPGFINGILDAVRKQKEKETTK